MKSSELLLPLLSSKDSKVRDTIERFLVDNTERKPLDIFSYIDPNSDKKRYRGAYLEGNVITVTDGAVAIQLPTAHVLTSSQWDMVKDVTNASVAFTVGDDPKALSVVINRGEEYAIDMGNTLDLYKNPDDLLGVDAEQLWQQACRAALYDRAAIKVDKAYFLHPTIKAWVAFMDSYPDASCYIAGDNVLTLITARDESGAMLMIACASASEVKAKQYHIFETDIFTL